MVESAAPGPPPATPSSEAGRGSLSSLPTSCGCPDTPAWGSRCLCQTSHGGAQFNGGHVSQTDTQEGFFQGARACTEGFYGYCTHTYFLRLKKIIIQDKTA